MKFTAEYTWLKSYLDNDALWLEDVLNWDETFDLVLSDYNIFSFLTNAFFVNSHFFLDSFTKMSFLDVLFFSETDITNSSRELFDLIMWDTMSFISNTFLSSQMLFYTDYQDILVLILHHSPELSMALVDYVNTYWLNSMINSTPSVVFALFSDSLNSTISEFVEYLVMFMAFIWVVVFFNGIFRIMKWNNPLEAYFVRFQNYLFWISRETRLQFEATIKIFFFAFFYTSMMIATFDDDQEEILEFFNGLLFNFFLSLFIYFLYKYSIHYFAFLEASVSEGRTLSFITKQCVRDTTNTFAFILRFATLMLRLNIYDTVDDIFDSYYIFLGDFDDDEYFIDLFFSMFTVMFFDTDNNDDRSFFLEDEMDLTTDLFALYFVVWGKFALFVFFIIEEIARVALALYITYLIVFEVHAVNRSFVEDTYFSSKRNSFNATQKLSNI